jgi:hypothetical protein
MNETILRLDHYIAAEKEDYQATLPYGIRAFFIQPGIVYD